MKIETLRARRMKIRCSQYMVAKVAGISRNRLSLIECGYTKAGKGEIEQIGRAIGKIEEECRKSPILRNTGGLYGN